MANFIAGYDDVSKRIPDDCELEADVIVASFAKNRSSSSDANANGGDIKRGESNNGKSENSKDSREKDEKDSGKNSSSISEKKESSGSSVVVDFTPRVCRVKDWPASGEEFGEAFPAQTLDLLKNLPMMGYTAR